MYKCCSSLTGDITGVTVGEKIVAMLTMLAGCSIFAYFMGAMATILAAVNTSSVRLTKKRAAVNQFVRSRKIPRWGRRTTGA